MGAHTRVMAVMCPPIGAMFREAPGVGAPHGHGQERFVMRHDDK